MRREAVETIERDGFRAEVIVDEDPTSPKEWDNVGTLVTWHRSYCFEEEGRTKFGDPEEFRKVAADIGAVYIDVGMGDHSGFWLYEGQGSDRSDPGGWDSGQVGFLYTTEKRWRELCHVGDGPSPEDWREQAKKALRAELEEWDKYVRGDVYGVVVTRLADDEQVDSCWGFYGFDYAKEEAKGMLENAIEYAKKQAVERRAAGARL